MNARRGVTLLEMMVVVILIGILASVGFINYSKWFEYNLDKDAFAGLKMTQAGMRMHKIDTNQYYPGNATSTDIHAINENLGLALLESSDRRWNYKVVGTSGCSEANRTGADLRHWYLLINNTTNPSNGSCP